MVFLMYHELETDGRQLCLDAPGYVRYAVSATNFRAQMNHLKAMGWRGVDVDQALLFHPETTAITFDDGCETDLLVAAPILGELGFGATFYITTGFLGKSGYLTTQQLRELSSRGFQIGCHAMTHAYLSDLDDNGLRREILESKLQLEQLIGKPVEHFSCPGGRYNRRSIEMARTAGYRTLSTSRSRMNSANADRFALGRIPVMRETTLRDFEALCLGRGLLSLRIRESLRQTAKRALGNTLYDRLRQFVLYR
jgi:peptidoglycan/xylan/chitin deacetylase (PgdA/CDA1 family)